jgi:hypothetical protein
VAERRVIRTRADRRYAAWEGAVTGLIIGVVATSFRDNLWQGVMSGVMAGAAVSLGAGLLARFRGRRK